MCADDLTLYRVVNNLLDASVLQYDLPAIIVLAKSWLFEINLSKCKVMHVMSIKPISTNFSNPSQQISPSIHSTNQFSSFFSDRIKTLQ